MFRKFAGKYRDELIRIKFANCFLISLLWFALIKVQLCDSGGNSLWEELYFGCGNSVSFYCVQNKLTNYMNSTFDSDVYITEGIYFVQNRQPQFYQLIDGVRSSSSSSAIKVDNVTSEHDDNNNDNHNRTTALRDGKSLRVESNEIDRPNNNEEMTMAKYDKEIEEEEEQNFGNFVRTVEGIEEQLEKKDRNETVNEFEAIKNATSSRRQVQEQQHSEARSEDNLAVRSLYQITDILYNKASQYFATHDLHLHLPQLFFGGSQLKISPRGFDPDGGILVKFNVLSELPRSDGKNGNFVSKYFHKVFKKKLLSSFLALLLIIKLIKIKLMYVLPFLIGVNHAKKLLLKTLLFLFPPLVHLFKLCTFYHAHASKLHFHHHKVKHHHHHIKVPVPVPIPVPVHKPHYSTHEEEYPPSPGLLPEYPSVEPYSHPVAEHGLHESFGGYNGGPINGAPDDYYNKNDMSHFQQHSDEFASWGLKDFYANTESPGVLSAQAQAYSPYAEDNYNTGVGSTYNSRLSAYPTAAGVSYKDPFGVNIKKNKNSNTWKNRQSAILSQSGTLKSSPTVLVTYDAFYSPILQKIDALFTQLGFNDEGCRERLICSMYKNPVRFSPHSNLLSTELSRDHNELEKPSYTNVAVIRFYRYVDAARNGQAQKDCLKLYTACTVKTE